MNKGKSSILIIACLLMAACHSSCGGTSPAPVKATTSPLLAPASTLAPTKASDKAIKIAAFNIQVFGKAKAGKPKVMDILAKIVRNFDITAIQEIRDASQTTMPKFKDQINGTDGPDYDFLISERLGRTSSKEQYAYLYNTETIEVLDTGHTYPEPTGADPFHREPFIAHFKAAGGSFNFVLIVIHADPDEATEEINALPTVVEYARGKYQGEDDFIILGDLNADCNYFDEDGQSPLRGEAFTWLIGNDADTTTKTTDCTYDRIIVTEGAKEDWSGVAGVYGFDEIFGITEEQTVEVSDHYPVWGEF